MTYPTGPEADPYLDPASGVLRNHLGITDARRLELVEAKLSAGVLPAAPAAGPG